MKIRVYSDGSCLDNCNVKNKTCLTGWSAIILYLNQVLVELYGQVELNIHSKYYLGAEIGSNNTAELTAIGEALIWLNDYIDTINERNIVIELLYDSQYAAKSVEGIFKGKKNKKLITCIREIYFELLQKLKKKGGSLQFTHVKGHSGDYWNEKVDQLANTSARTGCVCNVGRYASPTTTLLPLTTSVTLPNSFPLSPPPPPTTTTITTTITTATTTNGLVSVLNRNTSISTNISITLPPSTSDDISPTVPFNVNVSIGSHTSKSTNVNSNNLTSSLPSLPLLLMSPEQHQEQQLIPQLKINKCLMGYDPIYQQTFISYSCAPSFVSRLKNSFSQFSSLKVDPSNKDIILSFKYNRHIIDIVKLIPTRKYYTTDKTWRVSYMYLELVERLWTEFGGIIPDEILNNIKQPVSLFIESSLTKTRTSRIKTTIPREISWLLYPDTSQTLINNNNNNNNNDNDSQEHEDIEIRKVTSSFITENDIDVPYAIKLYILKALDSNQIYFIKLFGVDENNLASFTSYRNFVRFFESFNIPKSYFYQLDSNMKDSTSLNDVELSSKFWIDLTLEGFYECFLSLSSPHYNTFWRRYRGSVPELKERVLELLNVKNNKRQINEIDSNEMNSNYKYIKIE